MSDVQKVLDHLTAADAAIAAGRYGLQGEYRIAATLLQLAGALQVREPQPAPAPLPAHLAYAVSNLTQDVQCSDPNQPPHVRLSHPDHCATCSALAVRPEPGLNAPKASIYPPTTCVYAEPSGGLCGELIRFTEANGWYHVNDRRLGTSTHSATPQVTPGRLPARPV